MAARFGQGRAAAAAEAKSRATALFSQEYRPRIFAATRLRPGAAVPSSARPIGVVACHTTYCAFNSADLRR